MRSACTPAWRRASANAPNADSQVLRSVIACSMCSVATMPPVSSRQSRPSVGAQLLASQPEADSADRQIGTLTQRAVSSHAVSARHIYELRVIDQTKDEQRRATVFEIV